MNSFNRFDTLIAGYSALLLVGGLIGFMVAGSMASLIMSTTFAALLIGALFLTRYYPVAGDRAVYSILCLLSLFFAYRAITVKFMPAGILCLLTLTVLSFAFNRQKKTT